MEDWRNSWRAISSVMSRQELEALRSGLIKPTKELIRGYVVSPPVYVFASARTSLSITAVTNATDIPQAACVIGYSGWKGLNLNTTGDITDYYVSIRKRFPEDVRIFTRWFDRIPVNEIRPLLLFEVNRSLTLLLAKEKEDGSLERSVENTCNEDAKERTRGTKVCVTT